MAIGVLNLNHVNITVPAELEEAAKRFYKSVVGLEEIPKPAGSRQNMGAWYRLGDLQLHLSVEEGTHAESGRHVGYQVADIAVAQARFEAADVEILADQRPMAGQTRFYVRDPGGNLLEIVQFGDR